MGADTPANTGEARAIHRVACFACLPAPQVACQPLDHETDTGGYAAFRRLAPSRSWYQRPAS
ncbi:hypothetical protein DBL05_19895 [Pseudomonas putida]|nr:hypothetical protein DBL05_19895 [Pseudomonas putida]